MCGGRELPRGREAQTVSRRFAALVPAIAIGAAAERGRIAPVVPFLFCWATLVYCPLACWIWNPTGWAFKCAFSRVRPGVLAHAWLDGASTTTPGVCRSRSAVVSPAWCTRFSSAIDVASVRSAWRTSPTASRTSLLERHSFGLAGLASTASVPAFCPPLLLA